VQFIIENVYPGSAYADTAISKLFATSPARWPIVASSATLL